MRNLFLLIFCVILFTSCNNQVIENDDSVTDLGVVCDVKTEIFAPNGYEINPISEIDFNGTIEQFQFLNDQVGYAMGSKNVGGYVEVFKTTNGGQTWTNLNIGFDQFPRSMTFRDENFGIVTVHDTEGCVNGTCLNKTVILRTTNGGLDWEEIEISGIYGTLYHPTFDNQGNIYANLFLDGTSKLVKSITNGDSWSILFDSPDLDVSLVTFSLKLYDDQIFACGKDGKIIVINTSGQYLKTLETNNRNIWDVEVLDKNNLVVVVMGEVLKSNDGGTTFTTIYNQGARLIGFDNKDKGLMFLEKNTCPTDIYQVNDVIATTTDGGMTWNEASETTTNLRMSFSDSQQLDNDTWYVLLANRLMEIKKAG